MATYEIRKEPAGHAYRDQILALVRSRRETSERYAQQFRRKLPQWYDLWRGLTTGTWTPTKNNVVIPLIYSTIWSDCARKVATHFSQWPIVSMSGFGPDDASWARKQEAVVNAQFRDAEVVSKELRTFLQGDLYGTAVSQVMWDHHEEIRSRTDFASLPLSGERVRQIMRERIVTFDGPNYRNIDLLDFFPQPGYTSINGNQGMLWVLVRYYLDLDECRYMASEAGGRVFNSSEVERLASESKGMSFRVDEAMQRRFDARQGVSANASPVDRFTRPVELMEMWGLIPRELSQPFGSPNVVITVANENYLFRGKDNPFAHRQKPFISYSPTPDPHYFFAPGKAEIACQMQVAGNRFINQQLDAADLLIHPMFMYDRNKGINTRNLYAGPGRIFGVDGSPSDAIVPVPMDMRSLQVGGQMVQTMSQFVQQGSGVIEDTVMGLAGAGSDRQTAREFMGRREAAGTRLMLESVLYDAMYLEPLADMFTSLNSQFLEVPREVLILGDSSSTDPVTGQPIVNSRETITGEEFTRQYTARANGTTMSLSKETQKANDLTMFQILAGAQPMIAGSFNMVNFLRQMLTNLGYKNVNELIQKQPSVMEAMQSQGMNGAGQMPSDTNGLMALMGGGAPSGPMSGTPGMRAG